MKLLVGCCLCFSTHHMPYHVFIPSQMEHGPSSLLGWSLVYGFVDFFTFRGMFVCAWLYAIIIFGFVPRKWKYDEWTLGAATCPSQKSAMSVRRHTKVLVGGEGKLG